MTTAAAAAVGTGSAGETTTRTATGTTTTSRPDRRAIAYWTGHLVRARAATLRWRAVVRGRPLRKSLSRSLSRHSVARLRRLAKRWHRREHWAWWLAHHPPELRGWLCIHHYEGSWTDSGAPYWGGLQMDLSFQERYGAWLLRHKGTADHWSPLEQIWAAVRAWRARGFAPWPNTARYCGMSA